LLRGEDGRSKPRPGGVVGPLSRWERVGVREKTVEYDTSVFGGTICWQRSLDFARDDIKRVIACPLSRWERAGVREVQLRLPTTTLL